MKTNEIAGVVYRYYTDDGRSYVGCTMNERNRKYAWNCKSNRYGGKKIANARKQLGLGAFHYEQLHVILTGTKVGLKKRLEAIEMDFIKKLDSIQNGFNTSKGGGGNNGYHLEEQHRNKIGASNSKAVIITDEKGGVILAKSETEAASIIKVACSTISRHIHTNNAINGYIIKFAA